MNKLFFFASLLLTGTSVSAQVRTNIYLFIYLFINSVDERWWMELYTVKVVAYCYSCSNIDWNV